jgi:hypothetical protein
MRQPPHQKQQQTQGSRREGVGADSGGTSSRRGRRRRDDHGARPFRRDPRDLPRPLGAKPGGRDGTRTGSAGPERRRAGGTRGRAGRGSGPRPWRVRGWGCAAAPPEGNERETAPGPGKAAGWVGEANGRPPTKRNGEFLWGFYGAFRRFFVLGRFCSFHVMPLHILNRRLSSYISSTSQSHQRAVYHRFFRRWYSSWCCFLPGTESCCSVVCFLLVFLCVCFFLTELVSWPTAIIFGSGPRLRLRCPPLDAAEGTRVAL